MEIYVKSQCPYCGHVNGTYKTFTSTAMKPFFVACDLDEGGCDTMYVVLAGIEVSTDARKIEGVERINNG